jgi:branched-chain amino acid transport system permease protein
MVAVLLPEWLRFTEGFYLMGYALLVVVLMVVCPSGLLGLAARLVRPAARRSARSTAETSVAGPDAAVQSEGAR